MVYTVRPYKKGEEQYVAEAHRRVYREEYNWGTARTAGPRSSAAAAPDRAFCQ